MIVSLFLFVMLSSGVGGNSVNGQVALPESLSATRGNCERVFSDVGAGISTGNLGLFAKYFAPQVSLVLRDDETGTLSSRQTYYVLANFLRARKFAPLEFSTVSESGPNPYASGDVEFVYKGAKTHAQIYVALRLEGKKFLITQLSIY